MEERSGEMALTAKSLKSSAAHLEKTSSQVGGLQPWAGGDGEGGEGGGVSVWQEGVRHREDKPV